MARLILAPAIFLIGIVAPTIGAAQEKRLPPVELRSTKQYPGCPGGSAKALPVRAIDFSAPADEALLTKAWDSGVNTIIRYFDWPDFDGGLSPRPCVLGARTRFNRPFDLHWKPGPTLPAKTITRDEIHRMQAKGFRIGIVFQHCNQDMTTFIDSKRAAFDADRSIDLATKLAQPKGTTIFFGADFDAARPHIDRIKRYFRTVGAVMKHHGYKIGGYGNGYVCTELKTGKLISSCWLSQSTGFLGSRAYQASGDWDMQQCATRAPFKGSTVHFDTNIINPGKQAIGWWAPNEMSLPLRRP